MPTLLSPSVVIITLLPSYGYSPRVVVSPGKGRFSQVVSLLVHPAAVGSMGIVARRIPFPPLLLLSREFWHIACSPAGLHVFPWLHSAIRGGEPFPLVQWTFDLFPFAKEFGKI